MADVAHDALAVPGTPKQPFIHCESPTRSTEGQARVTVSNMPILQQIRELWQRIARVGTRILLPRSRGGSSFLESFSKTQIHHVLLIRPNDRLGDLLLLMPLLEELGRIFPNVKVDIVLRGKDSPVLFKTFSNVAHIYTLSHCMTCHLGETLRTVMQIRRSGYDLAIDPYADSQVGHWLAAVTHATYVIRAPGNGQASNTIAHSEAFPAPRHTAQWPVYLLRRAVTQCGDSLRHDYPVLDMLLSPTEHCRGRHILYVVTATLWLPPVIGIFADTKGAQSYPETWWVNFIDALHAQAGGFRIVEIEPPDGCSRLSSRFAHFFSPDIREVAAVISQMACFISADCGVMHLASATGIPTIGLFSVTDPTRYAPYGHGSCALPTHGKSPVELGQLAGRIIVELEAQGRLPMQN